MRIVISGNIGSGKTTQLHLLQNKFPSNIIFPEDVEEWIKEGWLQKFYSNKEKYATGFQFRVLKSHIKLGTDGGSSNFSIIERCPNITEQIFCRQLVEDGAITPAGYRAVQEYNKMSGWVPDCYIYIRTSPEICYKRIVERSREAEKGIPLDYLTRLHEKHDAFHLKSHPIAETHVIDGEQPKDVIFKEIMDIISQKMLIAAGFITQDK